MFIYLLTIYKVSKEDNTMDKKRTIRKEKKDITITIKIGQSQRRFMREGSLSPTKIFNEALLELGYEE